MFFTVQRSNIRDQNGQRAWQQYELHTQIKSDQKINIQNTNENESHSWLTLKNVWKTWDFELASKMKAKNVENPPLTTAGPISVKAFFTLSFLVPWFAINAWAIWAE